MTGVALLAQGGGRRTIGMQCSAFCGEDHRCGVFFDVTNKAADEDVVITGLDAAAFNCTARATLWVRAGGACGGAEATPGAWRAIWKGVLKDQNTSRVLLADGVVVPAGATRGFLLHSKYGHCVLYSYPYEGAEDDVLRVEPWYAAMTTDPFGLHSGVDDSWWDDHRKYTHAGAIHYVTRPAAGPRPPRRGRGRV